MSECKIPVITLSNDAATELGQGSKGNIAAVLALDEQGNVSVFISNEAKAVPTRFPITISEGGQILDLKAINWVKYVGSPTRQTICIPTSGGDIEYIDVYKS